MILWTPLLITFVTVGLHLLRRHVGLLFFFSTPSHHQSPVQYDLTALYDTM